MGGCSSPPKDINSITIRTKIYVGTIDDNPIISKSEIEYHLYYAESIFTYFKFEVDSWVLFSLDDFWYYDTINFDIHASMNENKSYMCIFYGIDKNKPTILGMAFPPNQYGIFINLYRGSMKSVLVHEIGHYFGLKHTFDDDGIEDTITTHDPTYNNIMNYHFMPSDFATPLQKKIMIKNAILFRKGQIKEIQ